MHMRFCEIDIVDVNDTSQKSGFLRNEDINLSNLYEINTLASIGASKGDSMDIDQEASQHAIDDSVKVITRSNLRRLAVAVGSCINIFSVEIETDYLVTQKCSNSCAILDMCWIGSSEYLAVYQTNMTIIIYSTGAAGALFTMDVSNGQLPPGRGTLSSIVANGTCRIVFTSENGCSGYVDVLNFSSMTDCNESRNTNSVIEGVESRTVHWSCPTPLSDTHLIDSSLYLVGVTESQSSIVDMTCEDVRVSDWDGEDFGYKFIRSAIVDGGRYFVGVTDCGRLVIRDLFLMITLSENSLMLNEEDHCIDFLIKDNMLFSSTSPFIALLISNSVDTKLVVRNIATMEMLYSSCVRPGTTLVHSAPDRVMLLVEPFARNTSWYNDCVRIREVCEANPEARLLTLISRKMFDEAELFANQFGIDLQRVYTAKMDHLLELSQLEGSKSAVESLVTSMKLVEDHDLVGDTCFTAATTLSDYEQIAEVLSYARKRTVSDPVTYQRLHRVSFVLTSYRLCCGNEAAYGQESYWPAFLEGLDGSGEWFTLFSLFITSGAIESARVLWSRHNQFISERLCDGAEDSSFPHICQMLENLTTGIYRDLACWKSVISFLDTDLIPEIIKVSTTPSDIFPAIVNFLIKLAGVLENYEPESFPDNSLHVMTTFNRVKSHIVQRSITPGQQALLAYLCQLMCSPDSQVYQTEKYARALIEIRRLKTLYDCSLKYEDYVKLNAETICYRILSKSLENPMLVSANVQKYARPYMNEHQLNPDLTLYKYIEEISRHFKGVVSASSPWEEQCLLVVETINVPHLKCKAVIMIAKGSFPPWNRKLSDAVHNVMNNAATDPELVAEMESVCRRAEMGLILLKYGVQLGLLDSITSSQSHFSGFLSFLLKAKLLVNSDEERLNDALKLNSLCLTIAPRNQAFAESWVYALYCSYLQKTSSTLGVIDFVGTLPPNESQTIPTIKYIVHKLMIDVDLKVRLRNEEAIEQRLDVLQTVQSLIMRFFPTDADMLKLYDLLAAAHTLQTKFKLWVTTDELNDYLHKKRLFLDFLRSANCAANEIYCFSDALALDRDDACRITIEAASTCGDPVSCSILVRDSLSSVAQPSQKLVTSCLTACSSILECLARASESLNEQYDEQSANEVVPHSTSIVYDLNRTMKQLIQFTDFSESLHEKAMRICGYLDLFMAVISQCKSDAAIDDIQSVRTSSLIVGISRRVGVYQLHHEGPILNQSRIIPLMCICARSVFTDLPSLRPDDQQVFREKQNRNWNSLLNDLMLENQDLLAISISVYATYLSCGFVASNLYHCTRNLSEKVVQTHPCDLWMLSSTVASLSLQLIDKLMNHLRSFVTGKKSPQTMINFLRLAQFITFHCGKKEMEQNLKDHFSKYLWAKQLGKAGVPPAVVKMPVADALKQFVKAKLNPDVVNEYLENFANPMMTELLMLKYAIGLVCVASSASCSLQSTELLEIAEDTIRCCGSLDRERAFSFFRCLLYMICPYKYEVIWFVISCLDKFAHDNVEHKSFVTNCNIIYNFVRRERKVKPACKQEINWYIEHQKLVDYVKQDAGCQRDAVYQPYGLIIEQHYTSGAVNSEEMMHSETLYRRETLLVSSIPAHGCGRLPFHVFLWISKADIEKELKPVIEYEMTTSNVLNWQSVVRQVSWLAQSCVFNRSYMLSTAIEKTIKEVSSRGSDSDLSASNIDQISALFAHYSRESVTSCVFYCYKKVPLGLAKISILELGLKAAYMWISKDETNSEERDAIQDHILRLQEAIKRYRTELLLHKAALYDAKTSDLVTQDCSQLISYLYSTVEWEDHLHIERVTRVIKELADIHDIKSLFPIHEKLVMQWLPETGGDDNEGFAVDMNDTMGGGEMNIGNPTCAPDDSGVYIMPVFDNSITRIVHLLSLIRLECEDNPRLRAEETALVVQIANFVNPKTAISAIRGGFKTRIRAACVLIRSYSSKALEEHNLSQDNLCVYLEKLCVARLIDLSGLEVKASALGGKDSTHICKTLLSNQRNSSELCHLVACTVIDHLICDQQLVEDLLNKLSMARRREMLMTMLLNIRDKESLHCIPNIASFWARTFDQEFSSLDGRSPSYSDDVKSLMYLLLSCPIEGRGAYDSIQSYLKTKGFPFTSALIGIVADATKPSNAASVDRSAMDPKFAWCNGDGNSTVSSSAVIAADAMEEDDLFGGDDTMLNF